MKDLYSFHLTQEDFEEVLREGDGSVFQDIQTMRS